DAGLARGRLAQADGGELGIGEDDPRDGPVVGLRRLAEDVHRGDSPLVLADVGEHRDAGHVADRPDALGGAAALVDLDPARVRLDSDVLEPDAVDARPAAGRDDELGAADLVARVELDDLLAAVDAHADRTAAEDELHAVVLQDPAEQLADLRVLAVGEPRRALDDRAAAAEAGEELRQLDRDDAAADEDDALRDLGQRGRLAV